MSERKIGFLRELSYQKLHKRDTIIQKKSPLRGLKLSLKSYLVSLPYLDLNLSIRPAVSTNLTTPVKNG